MFRYKAVVGVAEPLGDGSPSYVLRVAEKRQTLDEERPDTLEAMLNRLAAEGWEPWYLALALLLKSQESVTLASTADSDAKVGRGA
jgi:hypothetical protein